MSSAQPSPAASVRLRPWMFGVSVAILTVIAFQPAFDGQWLHWDDDKNFVEHEAWRGLSPSHLGWMFTTFHQGPYQPLSWVTLAVDHALWGMDPRGYHVTNVVLHALTAVAFFVLARALFARVRALSAVRDWKLEATAALAALAFAVHPLRVESVAWVTERRDVLSGLFLVLTVWTYVRFATAAGSVRRRYLVVAIAFYVASLLSKGLGFPLPAALIVLDLLVLERWNGNRAGPGDERGLSFVGLLREKIPFLVPAILIAIVAWIGQRTHTTVMLTFDSYPFDSRLVQSAYALFFYVAKTLWPTDLIVLVPLPVPLVASEARFVVAIAAVVIGASALWFLRRRARPLVAAFLAYAIFLAPVMGLTQTGPQLVADRYSYMPSISLALLFGGALLYGVRQGWTWLLAVGAALALALVPVSREQCRVWHDDTTLWTQVCAVRPADAPAFRNLALSYMRPAEAAMESDPAGARPLFEQGLAVCLRGLEAGPDAGLLANAASIENNLADVEPERRLEHLERGLAYAMRATELSEKERRPTPAAYRNQAWLAMRLDRPRDAVSAYAWLADRSPNDPEALLSFGQALVLAGYPRDALEPLAIGVGVAPHAPRMWAMKGEAHRALGEKSAAAECYDRAIRAAEALPPEWAEVPEELAHWRELASEMKKK